MTTTTTTAREPFSSIDSALQSGMRDPRERVALLRLEQALLDFMTGDPCIGWIEVGGPSNSLVLFPNKNSPPAPAGPLYQSSFHRLLVHRLSDRFGIIRERGLILDNALRLIKVPESKVPETLLRDLDPSEYTATPDHNNIILNPSGTPSLILDDNNNTNKPSPTLLRSESSGAGGGVKPRKLKIMKRQSSQPMKSSTGVSPGGKRESRRMASSSDLESREKAYAEARARIFSDGSNDEAKSTSSQNPDAEDSLGNSGHGLVQAVASRLSLSESSATSATPATPQSHQQQQAITDPATPDQPKAVYRNRAEEAADPDFQRGAAAVVFQQNNMYYGTTPSSSQYGYVGTAPPVSPAGMRGVNSLTASAPAFYPGAPYVAYPPTNAWQHHQHPRPSAAALQRPSGRADQEH